jgi:hypothetical protein
LPEVGPRRVRYTRGMPEVLEVFLRGLRYALGESKFAEMSLRFLRWLRYSQGG